MNERDHALASAGVAIKHLQLLSDRTTRNEWKLRLLDFSEYLQLDSAAQAALNLFPSNTDSDRHQSLFGLLNKGKTVMSQRLLTTWIKQPLLSLPAIKRRQSLLTLFSAQTALTLRQVVQQDFLRRVPDIDKLLRSFHSKKAGLQQIVTLWQFVAKLPTLIQTLSAHSTDVLTINSSTDDVTLLETEFLQPLQQMHEAFKGFDEMVQQTIDFEALTHHEYLINPHFQPALHSLSQQKDACYQQMEGLCQSIAEELGLEGRVKLNDSPNIGYHLRVSRRDETALRNKRQYMIVETRKDGVKFTTLQMKKWSREYQECQQEYEETQRELVKKAVEVVASYTPVLEDLSALLAELDLYLGLATVIVNAPIPYVCPTVLPMHAGVIQMTAARHPCLEVMDHVSFIPNNVHLSQAHRTQQQSNGSSTNTTSASSSTQIITGPNMGGKSTYIRQTGVIVVLAQMGMYVPCTAATISICDRILTRVGAGDTQLKGISTFMKEMTETSHILQQATPASLIIIDELGRGTSTYDGFGLAYAITEYIHMTLHSFCLISTHYHELTALAAAHPGISNKHVEVIVNEDDESTTTSTTMQTDNQEGREHTSSSGISMTHRVKEGKSDRSFGVHVACMAHLPAEIIEVARSKAAELEEWGGTVERVLEKHNHLFADQQVILSDELQSLVSDQHEQEQIIQFWRQYTAAEAAASDKNEQKLRELKQHMEQKLSPALVHKLKAAVTTMQQD